MLLLPIVWKPTKMDLAANEGKIKYMLLANRDAQLIDSQIMADNYTFEVAVVL